MSWTDFATYCVHALIGSCVLSVCILLVVAAWRAARGPRGG